MRRLLNQLKRRGRDLPPKSTTVATIGMCPNCCQDNIPISKHGFCSECIDRERAIASEYVGGQVECHHEAIRTLEDGNDMSLLTPHQ